MLRYHDQHWAVVCIIVLSCCACFWCAFGGYGRAPDEDGKDDEEEVGDVENLPGEEEDDGEEEKEEEKGGGGEMDLIPRP